MFRFSSLLLLAFHLVPLVVAVQGPCDIYASGGTPCVAAHSTTRALFGAYSGSLYQVKRHSDNATSNIAPLSAGDVANAASQDAFCAGTTCLITTIFDQSGRSNHLTQAPAPGTTTIGPDPGNMAAADGAPVMLRGRNAYGVFIQPGTGYRIGLTNGVAVGDAAQGMYAVLDGTHSSENCCFNYGNSESTTANDGAGHREAIYFGSAFAGGAGSGPWIEADLENGLFTGPIQGAVNVGNPTITSRFVTAVVKGEPANWAIRGADAARGPSSLMTFYSGPRPSPGSYNPMSKEGGIILGLSDSSQGTFYEGVLTSGYPSDATEDAVQANVISAAYAAPISVGSTVSIRAFSNLYIAHTGATVNGQAVGASDTNALKLSASWNVVSGLASSACVSFESRDTPGSFIRHSGFQLFVNGNDGSRLFHDDATWCIRSALNGVGNSIRSYSYPTHYFRDFNAVMFAASNGGPDPFDTPTSFIDNASWIIGPAFA